MKEYNKPENIEECINLQCTKCVYEFAEVCPYDTGDWSE